MSRMTFTLGATTALINSSGNFIANGSNVLSAGTIGLITSTNPSTSVVMELYKGTVGDFATLTNVSQRASDKLVTFECGSTIVTSTDLANSTGKQFRLGAALAVSAIASASGAATWFLLRRNTGNGDLTALGALIGTVGLTGTGADMEMGSVDVIAGNPYRSNGFLLNFYNTWTV